MDKPTPQQQRERLKELPEKIRDVLWAEETGDAIEEIAEKHAVENPSSLSRLTGWVLAGFLPIQKFRSTLQEELGISEEQARQIAYEIRERIFAQVAEELRKIHNLL